MTPLYASIAIGSLVLLAGCGTRDATSTSARSAAAGAGGAPQASAVSAEAARRPDFNGFWKITSYETVIRPEHDLENYTDEARRRHENFLKRFPEGQSKWPVNFCLYLGMPWTMLTRARDYATEIYQTDRRMVLFHEGMDMVRHIRFDATAVPENYAPSTQGYSIAHWEGEELVIVTAGLIASNEYSDLQRSDEAKITERWRFLKAEGDKPDRIEIKVSIEDPQVYRKPAVGYQLYQRAPEGTVVGGYNCMNTLWDDHVRETLERDEAAAARKGARR